MKKLIGYGLLAALVLLAVFGTGPAISKYNDLALEDQKVQLAYSQVQNVLNRQAELLPNMAEVAKGYAKFEGETFTKISAARSALSSVQQMSPADLKNNPDMQKKVVESQAMVRSAMVSLQATREAYPELKANKNFETLMSELSGSINRVTVERKRSQEAVNLFNQKTVMFPGNMFAKVVGFGTKDYYKAPEDQQSAPKLNMSLN